MIYIYIWWNPRVIHESIHSFIHWSCLLFWDDIPRRSSFFRAAPNTPHVPWIDVWSHHSHRGFTHIWDRLGCVNLGEMGLWIGSSHYPTPSTSINPSSTQFSSVRRASWPGAPKASWTGPFVARELDVSLQKCASPRKPMNISTRNPVMSPIMLVHKHRATCSAISTETRTVLHNCSHYPIVEISGHEVSFLPQYRDMFAASKPHFKVSSPPLSYQETSSGRPSSNKNIVYQQQFPS